MSRALSFQLFVAFMVAGLLVRVLWVPAHEDIPTALSNGLTGIGIGLSIGRLKGIAS